MADDVRAAREQAIERASACYAHDLIDVDELGRRLARAEDASSLAELEAAVDGLPAVAALVPARGAELGAPARVAALVRAEDAPRSRTVFAMFGGAERKGGWVVPRRLRVMTVMGGADLDFREARFAPGENRVAVFAMFGGVDIIVPPGLRVDVEGGAIFGGFEDATHRATADDPDAPRLVITGFAMFGGVSVEERLPGETGRQARKRRRHERRQLAGRRHRQLGPKP
jgi:hypothetical protein